MARVELVQVIAASPAAVFGVIANPRRFADAVGGVSHFEYLSSSQSGVGTKFRQTRTLNGRATTMDFEITESVQDSRVRILNETQGVVWDSLFLIEPAGDSTRLTMTMVAKTKRLLPRLMLPLVCGLIRKAVAKDLEAIRVACQAGTPSA